MCMDKISEYRVIIAGSRSFSDYELLRAKCDSILAPKAGTHDVVVLSGTAKGADRLGERYAKERGFEIRQFPAGWATFGKSAGVVRNHEMAKNADALIAFWDGKSKGTKNMIEKSRRLGLAVSTIMLEEYERKRPIQLDFMDNL